MDSSHQNPIIYQSIFPLASGAIYPSKLFWCGLFSFGDSACLVGLIVPITHLEKSTAVTPEVITKENLQILLPAVSRRNYFLSIHKPKEVCR